MSNFWDVGRFHHKFGLHSVTDGSNEPGPTGFETDARGMNFRLKFMQEELAEFEEGMYELNHEKMADALVDLVYVAMGTAHLLGYPWDRVWAEVQEANMAKERATSSDDWRSKRGHELDVVKPEGWKAPDVRGVLEKYGF